jgi:hypothetical protein
MSDDTEYVYELRCECGEPATVHLPTGKSLCINGHWVYTLRPAGDPEWN